MDEIVGVPVKRNSRAAGKNRMIQTNVRRRPVKRNLHSKKLEGQIVY